MYDHVFILSLPCAPLAMNPKTFSTECHLHREPLAAVDQVACSPHSPSSLSSFQVRSKANKAKGQAKGAWEVYVGPLPSPVTLQCTVILPGTFPLQSSTPPSQSSQIHDNKTT